MKYTKILDQELNDINAKGQLYIHNKSKARIVIIKNNDPNNIFLASFKTNPTSNSGICHIIEHSVLCGSKKYNVKDPFNEMQKRSLNTYMNALTYPDRTDYVVASINNRDFYNLCDVYLDGLFNPNFLNEKGIFLQEGFHYTFDNSLSGSGVVYNEMQGVLSDSHSMLANRIKSVMFKNSSYEYISGGNPKDIVNLKYEEVIEYYKKHYVPSNATFYFCGSNDFKDGLELLDSYLSKYEPQDEIEDDFISQKYDISDYNEHLETLDDMETISLNFITNDILDLKETMSLEIINFLLFDSNTSYVRKALRSAKLSSDIETATENLKRNLTSIYISNCKISDLNKYNDVIFDAIKMAYKNGLNYEDILSSISVIEFQYREANYGDIPPGISHAMESLKSFRYSDDPFLYFKRLEYYNLLKAKSVVAYFNELIKKYYLDNPLKAYVTLSNGKNDSYTFDFKSVDVTNKLKNEIKLDNDILTNYHLKIDKDIMPKLQISDINPLSRKYNLKKLKLNDTDVFYSDYFTNDIVYLGLYFDIKNIDIKLLPYIKLYISLIGLLDTKDFKANEFERLENNYSGGIYNEMRYFKNYYNNTYNGYLTYEASTKACNLPKVLNIIKSLINNTIFDKNEIYNLLLEELSIEIDKIQNSPESLVYDDVFNQTDKIRYLLKGCKREGYIKLLNELTNNYDEGYKKIVEAFDYIKKYVLTKPNLCITITASISDKTEIFNNLSSFIDGLGNLSYDRKYTRFNKTNVSRMYIYNGNINHNVMVLKSKKKYKESFMVFTNIINKEYMWTKLRNELGAYGASFSTSKDGYISFSSYRDPNIELSYKAYSKIVTYLENLNITQDELNDYIISTFQGVDSYMHPQTLGYRAFESYITGLSYKKRQKNRTEILNCSIDDLKLFIEFVKDGFNEVIRGCLCHDPSDEDKKIFQDIIKN